MDDQPSRSQIVLSGFDRPIARRTAWLAIALAVIGVPLGFENAVYLFVAAQLIASGNADFSSFTAMPAGLLPFFAALAVAEVVWRAVVLCAAIAVIPWAFRAVQIWLRPTTPAIWTQGTSLYVDLGWARWGAPLNSLTEATIGSYRTGWLKGDPVLVLHLKRGRPRRYPLRPLDAEPDTLLYRLNSLIDEPPGS